MFNENQRIQLTDTALDAIIKLAEGNPGAVNALTEMMKQAPVIDPDSFLGAMGPLFDCDSRGLYGPAIWIIYKYVCNFDVAKVLAIFRAQQLGLMEWQITNFDGATQSYPNLTAEVVAECMVKVQAELPAFNVQTTNS